MNENLSQMVKDTPTKDDFVFSETNLDLPAEEEAEEVVEKAVVDIVPLFEWFSKNSENFNNINQVKVSIRGVDSSKTLIMAVPDGSGEKDADGNDKRELRWIENADTHPALDLPGLDMQIYNNNTFRILHSINDNMVIKCYGIRTGLIVTFCSNIDGKLIPYSVVRVKKKDTGLEIQTTDLRTIQEKLKQGADVEALQLLYRQSVKVIDQFTTNESVVDWLITRQSEITDINHHLQIDNVIIDILK